MIKKLWCRPSYIGVKAFLLTTSPGCNWKQKYKYFESVNESSRITTKLLFPGNDKMAPSNSLGSGLESSDKPKSISNFDLTYSNSRAQRTDTNGSHDFLNTERFKVDKEGSNDTLIPSLSGSDVLKAKMNRIDSHHGNLEHLTRSQPDLQNLHK